MEPTQSKTPRLLGQLDLEITLTKRLPPKWATSILSQSSLVNEHSLEDDAFRPKLFVVRIEQALPSSLYHNDISVIAQSDVDNNAARSVQVAARFERAQWATGSVIVDSFYRLPNKTSAAVPGDVSKVDQVADTSLFGSCPPLATWARSASLRERALKEQQRLQHLVDVLNYALSRDTPEKAVLKIRKLENKTMKGSVRNEFRIPRSDPDTLLGCFRDCLHLHNNEKLSVHNIIANDLETLSGKDREARKRQAFELLDEAEHDSNFLSRGLKQFYDGVVPSICDPRQQRPTVLVHRVNIDSDLIRVE
ncbi:MAG: hypothetical protein Q9165_006511 [Trypethelium subeluteriae]